MTGDNEKSYSSLVKTLVVDSIINILLVFGHSLNIYLSSAHCGLPGTEGYSGEEDRQGICPYRAHSLIEEMK